MLNMNAFGIGANEGCGGDQPGDIPNNTYGFGRLDILASVDAILEESVPEWVTSDKSGGLVESGGSDVVTFTLNPHPDALPGDTFSALALITADAPGGPNWFLWIDLTVAPPMKIYLPSIMR